MRLEDIGEGVSFSYDPEGGEVETIETLKAVYEDGKFWLLKPARAELKGGERVRTIVEGESDSEDILALAELVHAGLSDEEMDGVERVALDREASFGEREA